MRIDGNAWKFGDDVNTDLIISGKYLELVDPEEMAQHAMEGIDPDFPRKIRKGDVVVGGTNFGCGSSREHAPLALKYAGIDAVVAESFARIFYRNAINIGLPALECPGIADSVSEGNRLEIDITKGKISNKATGEELSFMPMPKFMVEVLGEGGLITYIRNHINEW